MFARNGRAAKSNNGFTLLITFKYTSNLLSSINYARLVGAPWINEVELQNGEQNHNCAFNKLLFIFEV
jgi:hypothetical protein